MITHERSTLRQFYLDTFEKAKNNGLLSSLEIQVISVLENHPEYYKTIENPKILDQDFSVESGDINPFLHLGLHLGLREQINTNRPLGIQAIYQKLLQKYKDPHHTEHLMMDLLAEILWLSQKYQTLPDENIYLSKLQELLNS